MVQMSNKSLVMSLGGAHQASDGNEWKPEGSGQRNECEFKRQCQ